MGEQIYRDAWGNLPCRQRLKGREFRVIARGKMNTALVEFIDNGERQVISRNAFRKAKT